MIDLAREHSNEDEHEEEDSNGEEQHQDALHKASHHMFRLIVNLGYFSVRLLNIFCLQ